MTTPGHGSREWLLLPLTLGVADGILNALILASATVLHGRGLGIGLALRVGTVALISAVFTVFVAEYAQLRGELARAERELNLTSSGRLAASSLGRQVVSEAGWAAAVASVSSFLGAVGPLLVGVVLQPYSWTALVVSVGALGGLGAGVATAVGGRHLRWVVALSLSGIIVGAVGTALDIA